MQSKSFLYAMFRQTLTSVSLALLPAMEEHVPTRLVVIFVTVQMDSNSTNSATVLVRNVVVVMIKTDF